MKALTPIEAFLVTRPELAAVLEHATEIAALLSDAELPLPLRKLAKASLIVAFGLIGFGHARKLPAPRRAARARRKTPSAAERFTPDMDLGEMGELLMAAADRSPRRARAKGAPRDKAHAKGPNGVANGAPSPSSA